MTRLGKAGEPKEPRRVWTAITRSVRLAVASSPRLLALVTGLVVVSGLSAPVTLWFTRQFVDAVVAGRVSRSDLVGPISGLAVAAMLGGVAAVLLNNRQERLAAEITRRAEHEFLDTTSQMDLGYFDDPAWKDAAARAQQQVSFRPHQLTYVLVQLVGCLVTGFGMAAVLLSLSPVLIVLVVVPAGVTVAVQRRTTRATIAFHHAITPDDRLRYYLGWLLSDQHSAADVRAYQLSAPLLSRHDVLMQGRISRLRRLHGTGERLALLAGAVTALATAATYAFVARTAVTSGFTAGDLALLLGAVGSLGGQVALLSSAIQQIDEHSAFLHDLYSFMDLPPLMPKSTEPATVPARSALGIRFEGVRFTYPTRDEPALDGLDLEIRPGELMALVGENGAGKSTIVKLLLRLYDADDGRVLVGGEDVRNVDPEQLRGRIGVLFQDFSSMHLTAREAVHFGRHTRLVDDDEVWRALRLSRAESFVREWPDGLDGLVGNMFEGGRELSGGQWQRLALARLIYRDADILVLDEPTSALDAAAEAEVFAELRAHLHGRTGIIISHRFSTVRAADRIAVLERGMVTELGTHEELLATPGRYAALFELQAAGYR